MANFIAQDENPVIGKLKDYCTMQYGYTESSSVDPVGPKFLRITDIAQEYLDWTSVPYCSINDDNHSKYLLSDGDILVARTGATVGVAKMILYKLKQSAMQYFIMQKIGWRYAIEAIFQNGSFMTETIRMIGCYTVSCAKKVEQIICWNNTREN